MDIRSNRVRSLVLGSFISGFLFIIFLKFIKLEFSNITNIYSGLNFLFSISTLIASLHIVYKHSLAKENKFRLRATDEKIKKTNSLIFILAIVASSNLLMGGNIANLSISIALISALLFVGLKTLILKPSVKEFGIVYFGKFYFWESIIKYEFIENYEIIKFYIKHTKGFRNGETEQIILKYNKTEFKELKQFLEKNITANKA